MEYYEQLTSTPVNFTLPVIIPSDNVNYGDSEVHSRSTMNCIICLTKVRGEGEDNFGENSAPPRSVIKTPGFLSTFNQVWRILQTGHQSDIATEGVGLTLTSVVEGMGTDGSNIKNVNFKETPTMCQRCGDKVTRVEQLMKAVRQQVREIRMLYEQCQRKAQNLDRFSDIEEEPCLEFPNPADIQVKQDDWHWQQPDLVTLDQTQQLVSIPLAPQTKTSFISEASDDDETPMECDQDEDYDDPNEDDDDSESEDPDYIKSEQEDLSEESSEEEEDNQEEMISISSPSHPTTSGDPLAPAHSSTSISTKSAEWAALQQSRKILPKKSSGPFTCPVPECRRSIKTEKGLLTHTKKLHKSNPQLYPCSVPNCPRTFADPKYIKRHKKDCHPPIPQNLSPNQLICNLEGCTRILDNQIGLHSHKMRCHPEAMSELHKDSPKFQCSCGLVFRTKSTLSNHKRKNKATHPEYQPNLKFSKPEEKIQKCDLCNSRVKLSEIRAHLTDHLNGQTEYIVNCPNTKCTHMYTHSIGLMRHINSSSDKLCKMAATEKKIGLICDSCGYTADQRFVFRNHVENIHELMGGEIKTLKCPINNCSKIFRVKQSIYFHLSSHSVKNVELIVNQVCDKCGDKIGIKDIEEHLKDKHGVNESELIGCVQCPFKFSGRDEMVEHLYEHRNVGINCDMCTGLDKFFKYSNFREHYLSVHKLCEKRYKCGEGCGGEDGLWFLTKLGKDTHYKMRHQGEPKVKVKKRGEFFCEDCGTKFVERKILISHRIRVHGAEGWKCDRCGLSFDERGKLGRHVREVHEGVDFKKEWRCEGEEGCGKRFNSSQTWKRHKVVGHGKGERKWVCELCGKGYFWAGGLRDHVEGVHEGRKGVRCEMCGEGFRDGGVLKKHRLIHSGERPWGCEVCGQRFRHKEVMRRHVKGHEEKGEGFRPNGPMKRIRKRKVKE